MTLGNRHRVSSLWGSPSIAMIMVALLGIAELLLPMSQFAFWIRVTVAFAVFLLPGAFIFSLVPVGRPRDLIDFAGYGFAISLVVMGFLGLAARTLNWRYDTVETLWIGLSIVSVAVLLFKVRHRLMTRASVTKSAVGLLLIIAIQLSLFAYSGVLPIAFDYDQHTYNAEVTYFLRDEPLDWQEIYYETGNPISDRFYMSYWTLAQSFVVSISGIHILQAQMVINAIMVPLIAATIYIFGRNLGYDSTTSAIYVLVSLFCYTLLTEQHQTGAEFFSDPYKTS